MNDRAAPRMHATRRTALGALALTVVPLLGACGGLLETKEVAQTVYELRTTDAPALSPAVSGELVVLRPLARPGLDTDRIVAALPDRRLDGFRGTHWSAPVPDLVQSLLLDGLRARGAWQTVLPDRGEFRGRYALQTEIRDFQAEYASEGAAPTVRVTLRGDLGRAPERAPIVSAVGTGEVRATTNRMRDVVSAFESAYAAAANQLIEAVHAGARAAAGRPTESKPTAPAPATRAAAPATP